ncbi:MAG: hypothetical protein ABL917_01880 [Parcubacteria group bacterium]
MGKAIAIGQSLNLFSVLANNADWDSLDVDTIQRIINDPRQAGQQFTAFLRNGGKVIVGEPKVVTINRNRFNPKKFIGDGWSILNDETDARSIALTELDLTKVQHVTELRDGETYVKGEEKLKRLKSSDYIRLDADIFLTFWENQHHIPESWKEKVSGNTRFIYFDGTVLRGSDGNRYVLCLYWGDGAWYWHVYWLGNGWYDNDPSAVLAS